MYSERSDFEGFRTNRVYALLAKSAHLSCATTDKCEVGMSEIERNKQIVLAQHRAVWSSSDPDAVDRYYAPEVICHFGGQELKGSAQLKVIVVRRRAAFPDWNEEVELLIAESDPVASRVTSTATHTGPFLGMKPTGKRINISEMFLFPCSGSATD